MQTGSKISSVRIAIDPQHLKNGVLLEPGPDTSRITLWLPRQRKGGFRYWERVSEVPHNRFTVERGFDAAAATSIQARERLGSFFGRLLTRMLRAFRRRTGSAWLLPNGEFAEQCGVRNDDLMFVWAENSESAIDEEWVKARWPESSRRQRLGKCLYLVAGVKAPAAVVEPERAPKCPHNKAEQFVTAARANGDTCREAAALADLGAAYLQEGRAEEAVRTLQEALRLFTELGDLSRQGEVLCNLGLLILTSDDPARALEIFGQALSIARSVNDSYAEKTALERIGLAHVSLGNATEAVAALEKALALARNVGDRKHQADLLWYLAIQFAELERRDQAVEYGQAAIDLMKEMNNPKAAWFRQHLQKYKAGEIGQSLGGDDLGSATSEMSLDEPTLSRFWATPDSKSVRGPGLLRMAVAATKSMARFIGSGFKTAPLGTLQYRLRTCSACQHHTGLRCRLCGCFTSAKARMAHEECPIGKWPA